MGLAVRESTSIAELVIYVPAFLAALFVSYRQGFSRQLGFFYVVIFSAIRISGAVFEILSQKSPTSKDYAEWAGILSSVGLSPLLLATSGLLKRSNDLLEPNSIKVRILQFSHLPCLLGLILGIYGGTKLTSDESEALKFLKAASLLFLLVLLVLIAVAGATMASVRAMPAGETRIYLAVVLAFPFLAVRTVYAILADFRNDSTFKVLNGNAYVQLGMALMEEMIVTIGFLIVGVLALRMGQQSKESGQGLPAGNPSVEVHDTVPPAYV